MAWARHISRVLPGWRDCSSEPGGLDDGCLPVLSGSSHRCARLSACCEGTVPGAPKERAIITAARRTGSVQPSRRPRRTRPCLKLLCARRRRPDALVLNEMACSSDVRAATLSQNPQTISEAGC